MADGTAIEWADATFNPWEGCQKVGPGCDHCYAEARNARFGGGTAVNWGPGAPRRRTSTSNWRKPRAWNAAHAEFFAQHGRRQRVFCASLADVFDNAVDPAWRADLFALIDSTPHLDWLLLTKRIGNAKAMLDEVSITLALRATSAPWPPRPNVWLGATVVNQEEADRDIPKLLAVPARVRFISYEPALGSLWIAKYLKPGCERHGALDADGKCEVCEGRGIWSLDEPLAEHEKAATRPGLSWVIAGGESGPDARPMHPDWPRSLRDQCKAAGVPFLFKQWGEWTPGENVERVRGTVDTAFLQNDSWHVFPLNLGTDHGHIDDQPDLYRVGKKAAGRLLDGVTHDEFPPATGAPA